LTVRSGFHREVAQALFEHVRTELDRTDDSELASRWPVEFLGWSFLDPRATVARLEKVPVSSQLAMNADFTRTRVAEFLGLPYEQRRRKV
jgi:hypothetical protein